MERDMAGCSSSPQNAVDDPLQAKGMLERIAAVAGREIRVFVRPAAIISQESSNNSHMEDEPEDFYEFTSEDYARLMASKKEDVYLKTRQIREHEASIRRGRVTKATIRVQFPDDYMLEADFQPSDPVFMIFDMIKKLIAHPELSFYIYTSPPKQRLKKLEESMYDAGLAPGALVYFSYELPEGYAHPNSKFPYLKADVVALKDLHLLVSQTSSQADAPPLEANQETHGGPKVSESNAPAAKRQNVKPKWLKLTSK